MGAAALGSSNFMILYVSFHLYGSLFIISNFMMTNVVIESIRDSFICEL